jgi:hypothetical protein
MTRYPEAKRQEGNADESYYRKNTDNSHGLDGDFIATAAINGMIQKWRACHRSCIQRR